MFRVESKSGLPAAQAEFSGWALLCLHTVALVHRVRSGHEITWRSRVIRETRWAASIAAAEIGAARIRRRLGVRNEP